MKILITGASGAVCGKLTQKLKSTGNQVNLLTANLNKKTNNENFFWNIQQNFIEKDALLNVDVIVHLAGAGIADKAWSAKRKQELRDSRIKSTELLHNFVKQMELKPKKFICASAIGYYKEGVIDATEQNENGTDFMAKLCKDWEYAAMLFENLNIPTTIFRTGIIMDKNSGFYKQIASLAKYYLAAVPGNGQQNVSWISMDDMVEMYYQAIVDDSISGIYNAVAPNPCSQQKLIELICKNENRKLLLPNIPPLVLKLIYGEMAQVILSSKGVLPNKWISENRTLKYTNIEDCIKNC